MEKRVKPKPAKQFTIADDGFYGSWYKPEKDCFLGKAMVVFGGSAGSFLLTQMCAEKFCKAGMNVLATAYHDVPGAPSCLYGIPIELIENAAKWCKEHIADKIGVWGISLGGQLAFHMGSLCRDLVSCVVAVNPMHFSMQGVASFRTLAPADRACFTFRGKDLAYIPFGLDKKEFHKRIREDSRAHHEFKYIRDYYEELVSRMSQDADYMIPVENTKGAILMISAGQDTMLPSVQICEAVYQRLKEKGFAYPFVHKNYEVASHFLSPVKPLTTKIFWVERKHPKQCDVSRYVVFVGNNPWAGKTEAAAQAGSPVKKEIAFGFMTAGGRRENGQVVSIHIGVQLTVGGREKELSRALKEHISGVFSKSGCRLTWENQMDAWLKCHMAEILPVGYISYAVDCRLPKASKAQRRAMIDATAEGFSLLKALGYPIRPEEDEKLFTGRLGRVLWQALIFIMCKTPLGRLAATDHCAHAVSEMSMLDRAWEELRANGVGAPENISMPVWDSIRKKMPV